MQRARFARSGRFKIIWLTHTANYGTVTVAGVAVEVQLGAARETLQRGVFHFEADVRYRPGIAFGGAEDFK